MNKIVRKGYDTFTIFLLTTVIIISNNWTRQQGGDHLLFDSTTSTHSRTFRHIFATLHARWLTHIFFNRTACIYQTATRWGLPLYRITIWLFDKVILISVCLLDDLLLDFCYSNLRWETGGLERASIITLTLQANWLTRCASHLKYLVCAKLLWIVYCIVNTVFKFVLIICAQM